MTLWKKLLWIAVTILGLAAICVLALSRGEQVSALWIIIAGLCALSISYRFYSKWLATKVLVLNDERAPPAIVRAARPQGGVPHCAAGTAKAAELPSSNP